MLTTVDLMYHGVFISFSFSWKGSIACSSMAVLSAVSANVSLILLVLLTGYRYLHIVFRYKTSVMVMLALGLSAWMYSLLTAVLPLLVFDSSTGQFIQSDACTLFNFVSGKHVGWVYGTVVFVVANLALLFLMMGANTHVIIHVVKSSATLTKMGNVQVAKERKRSVLKSMLILTSVTLVMWLPVTILSILASAEVDIPNELSR